MLIYKNIFELNSMQLNVHVNVYDRVRLETFGNVQFQGINCECSGYYTNFSKYFHAKSNKI